MEMNFEKPKSRSAAKSRTAVQSAPLWEMNEMFPQAGIRREKLAFRLTSGRGLITPRQLGPTRRTFGLPAEGDDPVFDLQPLAADLAETGGDDHDPLDPLGDGLLHRLEAGLRRQDDDGEIDLVGDRR